MVKLRRPKVRLVGIVFLFLCFLVFIFYLVFKSDFLTIKNVNCFVKDKTSIADEKRWCEEAERSLQGRNILSNHSTTVVAKLVGKFLPVGEVKITKKYPKTVLVQIAERRPIARICPSGGREFLVDKEGVIYAEVLPEFQNLPKVTLDLGTELQLGQKLEPEIVSLILLEESTPQTIKLVGQEGIEVRAGGDLTILFSRQKDLTTQIHSLQTILQKYRIEGKSLKQVDLRYGQPVVKY